MLNAGDLLVKYFIDKDDGSYLPCSIPVDDDFLQYFFVFKTIFMFLSLIHIMYKKDESSNVLADELCLPLKNKSLPG